MDSIGIVAGTGRLPLIVAKEAVDRGHKVVAIAFPGFTDPALQSVVAEVVWLKLGQLQKAISALKDRGIHRVIMAGKIEKSNLLRLWRLRPDRRAIRLVRSLEDWRDDTVLAGVADELLKEGIVIDEITSWASRLMAPVGVLTVRQPKPREWNDISFGREMALGIGALDIGQTVVVKNSAVIVVEAIEGTDKAIRRAGELNIPDSVVVKMAKPAQDMRFDVPGVGPITIESMIQAKATVLAIESGKTMITDCSEMVTKADQSGIAVVGIPPNGNLFRQPAAMP